jgi:hypothetical protein
MQKLISVFAPVTFMSYEIVFRTHALVIWELEKTSRCNKKELFKTPKKAFKR